MLRPEEGERSGSGTCSPSLIRWTYSSAAAAIVSSLRVVIQCESCMSLRTQECRGGVRTRRMLLELDCDVWWRWHGREVLGVWDGRRRACHIDVGGRFVLGKGEVTRGHDLASAEITTLEAQIRRGLCATPSMDVSQSEWGLRLLRDRKTGLTAGLT